MKMKYNQKPCTKTKKVIDKGKRNKTLREVKPGENISKNLQSLQEVSPVEKEVLPSHKLQDHAYEYYNPFTLKEDNLCLTKKLPESIELSRFVLRKDSKSTEF